MTKILFNYYYDISYCRSRQFNDYSLFLDKLNEFIIKYGKPNKIVSGGAIGADTLSEKYANDNNISTEIFLPDWKKYGKKAGILRNTDIINAATHVIAFPSHKGSGTQDSINKAQKENKICVVHWID